MTLGQKFKVTARGLESERGLGNVAGVWGSQMGWDAVTYMIKEFWPDLRDWAKTNKQASSNAGTH
jgi:hypothetical protein